MTGTSGCFGSPKQDNETIDTLKDVYKTVDDITNENPGTETEEIPASYVLARHYVSLSQKVRLLTYAVVALAAVVIIKEL